MTYTTKELTPATWADFERLFAPGRGWSFCACMLYQRGCHLDAKRFPNRASSLAQNLSEKRALVDAGRAHGILVYDDSEPIGWCQFGPAEELPLPGATRLDRRIPPLGPGVRWRITCFVTIVRQRRRGVASTALRSALNAIRERGGGLVEAYPTLTPRDPNWAHAGAVSLHSEISAPIFEMRDDWNATHSHLASDPIELHLQSKNLWCIFYPLLQPSAPSCHSLNVINNEEVYEMNTLAFLEGLLRDVRHAFRMIRMNPGFSAAAILSLALGIGANTAIFSVVNAVLIRPLPYPEPESLVGVFNSGVIQGETFNDMGLAPGMYAGLKEHSKTFQEFGVWLSGTATVTGLGDPEQIKTVLMTQGVLPALGARPFLGNRFSIEDDMPGTAETVILSHSYWMRRFGGDERVLGRTVVINFVPRQVIGVMPRTFRFLDLSPDVLLPQRFAKANLPFEPFSYSGIARLKPGITMDLANQDATRVLNQIIPETIRPFAEQARLKSNLRPLKRDVTGEIGTVLGVVMGALCLVFLLVCANVANLVLVRAQARTQEFAIRAALGAGRGRIARELLVESLTLGLFGAAFGIALAYGAVRILKAQDLTTIPRLAEVSIDAATLAFDLACSVMGSLLFGLIAVFKCGIPSNILSARGASMSPDQLRAQNVLVVAQVALALVLLVASGLLIRTFLALRGVHPGFTHPERIQTIRIVIPNTQAPEPERVARMQAEIVENVSRLPGVETAAFADGLAMDADYRNGNLIAVEDKFVPGQPPPNRRVKYVSPGLFAAQGTRLLAGRDFTWEDLSSRRLVAIVSESMARENWGKPNAALGKRLRPVALGDRWLEVVGVVEDVHDDGSHRPAPPIVYFRTGVHDPWRPDRPPSIRRGLTLAIRSGRANTESFLREVAAAIHAVSPTLPLAQVRTLDDVYRRSMARTSFTLVLLGIAGTMALALAVIGVYGVLAYAVGQRRREVSIRVALGAQPNQVTGLFLRRGILLASVGSIVGVAAAMGLSRWVSSLLFGVTALDPATYVASALIVFAAALIASYIPARRALSVNPMESLRAD